MLGFYSQAGVNLLLLVISFITFAGKVWALADCLSRRSDAFVAAGKLTKPIWLGITGVAVLVHLVVLDPLFILNIIGVIAAIVYLVDVRPALRQVGGGGRWGRGGSGGSSGW